MTITLSRWVRMYGPLEYLNCRIPLIHNLSTDEWLARKRICRPLLLKIQYGMGSAGGGAGMDDGMCQVMGWCEKDTSNSKRLWDSNTQDGKRGASFSALRGRNLVRSVEPQSNEGAPAISSRHTFSPQCSQAVCNCRENRQTESACGASVIHIPTLGSSLHAAPLWQEKHEEDIRLRYCHVWGERAPHARLAP